MKTLKKLGALLLVVVMMLSLSVTAFADGELAGSASNTTRLDSFTFNVTLTKKDGVNTPAETVTYAIAPAAATDVANPYHVGPSDGIKFDGTDANKASFPVNASGTDLTQTVTVTIDKNKFTAAGIYRYKITETVNNTDLGFAAKDATTKYIDVYAKAVEGSGIVVYAVTMANSLANTTKVPSGKDTAFEIGYAFDDNGTPTDPTDDTVKSYDVTISKTLGNGGAEDPAEYFHFAITVKGLTAAAGVNVTVGGTHTATIPSSITLAASDATYNWDLKGGETVVLQGLPKTLALEVVESMDSTGYAATMSVSNMDNADTSAERTAKGKVNGEGGTIAFTNTRTTISPTGVVMHIAPYALIMCLGILLLVYSRKSRKAQG